MGAGGQRTLFREVLRDTVLIFASGEVSPVSHCDPTACSHRLNTDHVIRVDVGIVLRSFDKYKFGHGLPSRLHLIRGEDFNSQSDAARRLVPRKCRKQTLSLKLGFVSIRFAMVSFRW